MKVRGKVLLGAAGAAVVAAATTAAATTGAAQAAADKPQSSTARVTPAVAGHPQAATAFLNVKVTAKTVTEAGSLKISVKSTTCITDVIAWAFPGQAFGGAASGKITKKGTSFALSIAFPKSKATGTWFLTDINAVVCNTKPAGWNANWNGAYKFTVKK